MIRNYLCLFKLLYIFVPFYHKYCFYFCYSSFSNFLDFLNLYFLIRVCVKSNHARQLVDLVRYKLCYFVNAIRPEL